MATTRHSPDIEFKNAGICLYRCTHAQIGQDNGTFGLIRLSRQLTWATP